MSMHCHIFAHFHRITALLHTLTASHPHTLTTTHPHTPCSSHTAVGEEDPKFIGMNEEGASSLVSMETTPTIPETSAQHNGYPFPPGIPGGGGYEEEEEDGSEDEGTDEES